MRFTLQTLFVAIAVGLCSSATAFSADRLPVQLNGDAALSNVGSTAMSESAQACGVVLDTRGCLDPTWSPDGKKIAYLQGKFCCGPADVYVMRTDGSAPKLIAQGQLRCGLDWSPNGRRLVFSAARQTTPAATTSTRSARMG